MPAAIGHCKPQWPMAIGECEPIAVAAKQKALTEVRAFLNLVAHP